MSKDMKLIMETWRKFEETAKDKETHIFLFENKKPVKTNFNVLLEQYDSKQLTEDQLIKLWEDSFNYEYEQLLKEVDWEKEAEMTADPDYKPPHERGVGMGETVSDLVLKASIQARDLINRGGVLAIKALGGVARLIKRFGKRHPVLAKIALVTIMTMALTALMAAVSDPEALAQITQGGEALTDKEVNWVRGSFDTIHDASETMQKVIGSEPTITRSGMKIPTMAEMEMKAQVDEILKLAQASPDMIPIETIEQRLPQSLQKAGKISRVLTDVVTGMADEARESLGKIDQLRAAGDTEAANKLASEVGASAEILEKWRKLAETTNITTHGIELPTPEAFRNTPTPPAPSRGTPNPVKGM